MVTIVGAELDLQLTETARTSLLVQANRAMLDAGKHIGHRGESRTRSFRQSFLMAYAQRIGERLQATTDATQAAVPEADADRLLPVLSKREEQVDALFTKLFPNTAIRRTRITNGAGWEAGLTAADLAHLDARRQVRRDAGIPGVLRIELDVQPNATAGSRRTSSSQARRRGMPRFEVRQHNVLYLVEPGITRGIHAEPWDKYLSPSNGRVFAQSSICGRLRAGGDVRARPRPGALPAARLRALLLHARAAHHLQLPAERVLVAGLGAHRARTCSTRRSRSRGRCRRTGCIYTEKDATAPVPGRADPDQARVAGAAVGFRPARTMSSRRLAWSRSMSRPMVMPPTSRRMSISCSSSRTAPSAFAAFSSSSPASRRSPCRP